MFGKKKCMGKLIKYIILNIAYIIKYNFWKKIHSYIFPFLKKKTFIHSFIGKSDLQKEREKDLLSAELLPKWPQKS